MAKGSGVTWDSAQHVPDIHTGESWSEMAIEDLRAAWEAGYKLEELSSYLCRDWQDITAKCKELGLDLIYQPQRRRGYLEKRKRQIAKKCPRGRIVKIGMNPSNWSHPASGRGL